MIFMNLVADKYGDKTRDLEQKMCHLFGDQFLKKKQEGIKYANDIYTLKT